MRAKLVFTAFVTLVAMQEPVHANVMWSASTIEELREWAVDLGCYPRVARFDKKSVDILVLIVGCGSAFPSEDIYLYVRNGPEDDWYLVVMLRTGATVSVETDKAGKSLLFRGKTSPDWTKTKTLLIVPLDSL